MGFWCSSLSLLPLLFPPHLCSFWVWSRLHLSHPCPVIFPFLHLPSSTSISFTSASLVGSSPFISFFLSFSLFIWLPSLLFLSLQGNTIESEHLSELTEEEYEAQIFQRQDLKGFMWLDAKYLNPFFTRRLTQEVSERDPLNVFHCFPVVLVSSPFLQLMHNKQKCFAIQQLHSKYQVGEAHNCWATTWRVASSRAMLHRTASVLMVCLRYSSP